MTKIIHRKAKAGAIAQKSACLPCTKEVEKEDQKFKAVLNYRARLAEPGLHDFLSKTSKDVSFFVYVLAHVPMCVHLCVCLCL